jgi:hypothetical protein
LFARAIRVADVLHGDGWFGPDVHDQAIALAAIDVIVWVRLDLSSWVPGGSQLVIAARGLPRGRANDFGFISITEATAL